MNVHSKTLQNARHSWAPLHSAETTHGGFHLSSAYFHKGEDRKAEKFYKKVSDKFFLKFFNRAISWNSTTQNIHLQLQ